jgi:hypothetical protein
MRQDVLYCVFLDHIRKPECQKDIAAFAEAILCNCFAAENHIQKSTVFL